MRKTANRLADSAASVGYMNGWNAAHDTYKVRIAALEAALAPFARMAESYRDDPGALVIASKGGTILSVYDLRAAMDLCNSTR